MRRSVDRVESREAPGVADDEPAEMAVAPPSKGDHPSAGINTCVPGGPSRDVRR
jgi:hypothetical protein